MVVNFTVNFNSTLINVMFNSTVDPTVEADEVTHYDWPLSVRYGVPLLCVLSFSMLLLLLYKFPSPHDETENFFQRKIKKKSKVKS